MKSAFSRSDKLQTTLMFAIGVLVILILASNAGRTSLFLVATVAGIGLISASLTLAWGTEALQFVVSQVLALAILALVQVLPEYSIEAVIAYHAASSPIQITYATASLTGANRLLLGLGWPIIVFIAYIITRRKSQTRTYVELEPQQSVEVFFLAVATAYSFLILAKRSLDVSDGIVLSVVYFVYLYVARKIPAVGLENVEGTEGPALAILRLSKNRRLIAIASFLVLGLSLIVVAADPFVRAVLQLAVVLNLSPYFFVQWVAPVLTELPETITAYYWATRARYANIAIANLVSSKVNQWTLLMATIPVVYNIALGRFQSILLSDTQISEIFLTAAQSSYGVICLLDLKFGITEASTLLALFLIQFFFPEVRLIVSLVFIALSIFELIRTYRHIVVIREFKTVLRDHVFKKKTN